jgi:hypothetical protein
MSSAIMQQFGRNAGINHAMSPGDNYNEAEMVMTG